MTDRERAELQRRFEEHRVPERARLRILNAAREKARQERTVYRHALAELRAWLAGRQKEIPWTRA